MSGIKQRRLNELTLSSHPGLDVGDCVPFYFRPRSVMLYLVYQGNHPEMAYRGGQGPILHFETLVPGAVKDAKGYLDRHDLSRARFERVTQLVEGFESPYGLELLANVHWVISREGATQHDSVERQVYGWNSRKRKFTPRQLAIAEERLRSQGWLSPQVAAAH